MPLRYPQPIHYRPLFPEELLDETLGLVWFSAVRVEEPGIPPSAMKLKRVPTVSAALAGIASDSWEDFRLERRNDLTSEIAARLRDRDSEWNKCALAFRDYFDRMLEPIIRHAFQRHELPDSLLSAVRWDIISYWQEMNYKDVRRPAFFTSLFDLYRRGHLPCGWEESDIHAAKDAVILYR